MILYPTHKIVQEILPRKNKQIICNNLNSLLNNSVKVASNVIKSVKKAMISCATPSSLINQLELTKDNEMFAQQHILQLVTTIIVGINYFNAFQLLYVVHLLFWPCHLKPDSDLVLSFYWSQVYYFLFSIPLFLFLFFCFWPSVFDDEGSCREKSTFFLIHYNFPTRMEALSNHTFQFSTSMY